ncbi:MAG: type II toxin-antitoxin system prevent-host-death family antitoxin [Geminicoccaceae bacterium]|jgi:prevent-host-death family protein|nr:type II toxin-antitoxin system prevent-host-death family antitoxin [Geminicoccaceae bacterium]
MRRVRASDVTTQFAAILSSVERGESFVVTCHGKPIARIVPAASTDPTDRAAALERFRLRRASWHAARFSTDEILAARHEGHRN